MNTDFPIPRSSLLLLALLVAGSSGCRAREATEPPKGKAASPNDPPARPASAAAEDVEGPVGPGANVLVNPGFEQGKDGWTHMGTANWGAFDIVASPARSGAGAARLEVKATAGTPLPPSRVFGVVQEIRPDELPGGFPETLAGWFRVESWTPPPPGTFLYVQVVAIVWGDPRAPALVGVPDIKNYQIRFMLGGSATAPFTMSNAKYDFVATAVPPQGVWIPFEIPLRRRFQEHWGVVPEGYEFLRVLFEARWDHKPLTAGVDATVLYDDLFVGYGSAGTGSPAAVP